MRILILGGAGFIGSHLAHHYQQCAEVVVLDDLSSGSENNLSGMNVSFMRGSILDDQALRNAMSGVEIVFHLAAMTSVPESMEKPIECLRINVEGTLRVLQAAVSAGAKTLVFASSAAIYGNNPEIPKHEDMVPDPLSPYAVTKLDGEYYCDMYSRTTPLRTVCLRFFNVFGPRQNPDSAYASAVPIFMKKAFNNEDIVIHGDGTQTRDFIRVEDVVTAMAYVAENSDLKGVFNIGYGSTTSINDLVSTILKLSGSSSQVVHTFERPGDVKHSLASVKKITTAGLQLENGILRGLQNMVELERSHACNGQLLRNP